MTLFDTIAAISTPMGKGGVALIRLSGPEAIAMAEKVFTPKCGKPLSACTPRMAVYGDISSPVEPHMTVFALSSKPPTLLQAKIP